MDTEIGFEAALQRLERAVEALEAGDLGLDGALAKYEEGVRLLAHCHGLLDAAERKVTLLTGVDGDGNAATTPFDATAPAERESAADGQAAPKPPKQGDGLDDLPF